MPADHKKFIHPFSNGRKPEGEAATMALVDSMGGYLVHQGTSVLEPPQRRGFATPERSTYDEARCERGGTVFTRHCIAHPGEHPAQKWLMGCARAACPDEVCQRKLLQRRMGAVYHGHLAFAAAHPLLHLFLTVPAHLRPLVSWLDAARLRKQARVLVEEWLERHLGVDRAEGERLFLLNQFHPAGSEDEAAWHPHFHFILPALAYVPAGWRSDRDGQVYRCRPTPARVSAVALDELRDGWTAALVETIGQPVLTSFVRLVVHHEATPHAQRRLSRRLLARELRGFPCWEIPEGVRGLAGVVYSGAFATSVWSSKVRPSLGIAPRPRRTPRCRVCEAPMVPFCHLEPSQRQAALSAATDDEHIWHVHGGSTALGTPLCTEGRGGRPCEVCHRFAEQDRELRGRMKQMLGTGLDAVAYLRKLRGDHPDACGPGGLLERAGEDLLERFEDWLRSTLGALAEGRPPPLAYIIEARQPLLALIERAEGEGVVLEVSEAALARLARSRAAWEAPPSNPPAPSWRLRLRACTAH